MPSVNPWRFDAFRDPTVPKLHNLFLAAAAGLRVPLTCWARAEDLAAVGPAPLPSFLDATPPLPCIVRSGSPTEDTAATSNAGRFTSLVVPEAANFARAVADVIASLPLAGARRRGVVFVQPFIAGGRAGVTFFDGFYYEETAAVGGNQAITAGLDRGEVRRGHLQRGDPWHDWLGRVHAVFGGTLDVEWAEPAARDPARQPVLLQVRPALFPLKRCETLSLANHKEILGDLPSPWMVGVLAEIGRPVLRFFERVDPPVAAWRETYSVELGERAWLNFSFFFRLMDRWGMPRSMVTEGVGGDSSGPLDARYLPGPLLRRSLTTLPRLALACLWTVWRIKAGLRALDDALSAAHSLDDLQRVNARALEFSVRTNFAIMILLSVASRFRRTLGLRQAARVITQQMMVEYAAIAARPDPDDRRRGLDDWLGKYGHRGPLESDPMRPRFAELRPVLQADLARGPSPTPPARPRPTALAAALARPLFLPDEVRESFRDRLMRWWRKLRVRILEEARRAADAGHLDSPEDVFFLRAEDLAAGPASWRARAADRRAKVEAAQALDLPATAPRDAVEALIAQARRRGVAAVADRFVFVGIGLGRSPVSGTAVRASDLTAVLAAARLPDSPVLVVDTLEPSWAVVFPRFSAVVAELGGELSHASILLREAGIPAVVNARGAFRSIADGDLLRVDPAWGEVRIEARASSLQPPRAVRET